MAKKVIAFSIEIKGTPSTVKALQDLNKQVAELAANIQNATDPAELAKLQKEYVSLKANIKALNEEQNKQVRDFKTGVETGEASLTQVKNRIADIKKEYAALSEAERGSEFGQRLLAEQVKLQTVVSRVSEEVRKQTRDYRTAAETGEGSYRQLSNRLTDLRKQYNNLGRAAREGDIGKALLKDIQALDKELKDLDAASGTFTRNVGNYPKLVKQFIRGAIPGFEAFEQTLEGVGISAGKLNTILSGGFFLFQVASLLIKAGQAFSEFTKEVDAARAAVASLTGLTGAALDDATARSQAIAKRFGKDIDEVTKAALTLSKELGIGYSEALDQIEKGFVAGLDANGDFLDGIKENAKALQNLGEATDEFSQRQRRALESQKELSRAQVELAKRFADSGNDFEVYGNLIQAALIQTLLDFLDLIQPVINLGKELFNSLRRIGEALGFFSKEGDEAQDSLSGVNKIMEFQIAILTALVGVITAVVSGFADFVQSSPLVQSAAKGIGAVFSTVIDAITKIPSALAGAFAAIRQFFANVFETGLDDEAIQGQMANLRAQGLSEEQIQNEIARQARAGRGIADAFSEAYNASLQAANAKNAKVVEEGNKRIQVVEEEANKEALERAKKIAEERAKFLDGLKRREEQNAALLLELQRRLTDAVIAQIEDENERAIETEREGQRRREAELIKGLERQKAEVQKSLDETAKIFGANSKEVKVLREQSAAELLALEIATNKVLEAERANSAERILQIEAEATKKAQEEEKRRAEEAKREIERLQQERIKAFEGALSEEREALRLSELRLEEQRARGFLDQEAAAKMAIQARIDAILNQLAAVQAAEERLAQAGVQATDTEAAAILAKRQELNTELAKLEEEQTKKVQDEARKQVEARRKTLEQVGQGVSQGITAVDGFLDGLAARETARTQSALESIAKTRAKLEEQLQQASGLEREFLEQRIRGQSEAAERLAAEQKAIQEREARRNKAVAVAQSVINTALGISSALAQPPGPPATIPFAVLAGVLGAVQTAAIAAAPAFAKGGLVGAGNIPAQPNGDNVLATVKTGEVVLTKQQQIAVGGPTVFARAGVPGFASGGLVGRADITPPRVPGFDPLLDALNRQTERRVVLVTEDLYREQGDISKSEEVRIIT